MILEVEELLVSWAPIGVNVFVRNSLSSHFGWSTDAGCTMVVFRLNQQMPTSNAHIRSKFNGIVLLTC